MDERAVSKVMRAALAAEAAGRAAARAVRDPDALTPEEAAEAYKILDRAERSLSASKAVIVRRVVDSGTWRAEGFASPADHLASVSGRTIGAAKGELELSQSLASLAATQQALLDGTVSTAQGLLIADAAKVNPVAEGDLIRKAGRSTHKELKDEALRAKVRADADRAATEARIHAGRRASSGTDAEGAWTLHVRTTAEQGSVVDAELERQTDKIFREKARAGSAEPREAYKADAIEQMARKARAFDLGQQDDGSAPTPTKAKQARPEHLALLRLDITALQRGHVEGDELCEITGIGPVSVEAARRLLGEATLKVILTKGVDVMNVTSLTRGPGQAMRFALMWSSPECSVTGCNRTILEYDHRTGSEYADTRHTRLDELDRLCGTHHDLHTHHGWALVVGRGNRPMVPPDDPRHPSYRPPPAVVAAPPVDDPPRSGSDPADLDLRAALREVRATIDRKLAQQRGPTIRPA